MNDPILAEIRKHREEILQSYGSLRAYHDAIIHQQKQYANRLVSLQPKKKTTTKSRQAK